ncbi:MAG: two-component regulator propeller domain-containing protein [Spirosomataceae bacterium]|jgi:signal transduction histidine kinase/ligand-binding sensor domain-containing protein/DNA-binding response OmpR family regulator
MKKKILLIACLVMSFHISAQQSEYKFINFSSKNGLASNSVNTILKDKNGFMWFGTEDGLNKFDGQKFIAYRHSDRDTTTIGRGPVLAMTLDKNKNIWLATNLTLSLYNLDFDSFINFNFSKYGWIINIFADKEGFIWVGTYSGLFKLDPITKKITAYKADKSNKYKLKSNVVRAIFEDSKNNFWVGTEEGLHLFDRKNNRFNRYIDSNNSDKISDNHITCISEDQKGNIWVGTNQGGINLMKGRKNSFLTYKSLSNDPNTLSSNRIHKIVADKTGLLWIGTESNLDILNPSSGKVTRVKSTLLEQNGFTPNPVGRSVRDIYIDNAGIYWIAFFQAGINKYDTNLAIFNHKQFRPFDPNGLSGSSVMSFAEGPSGEIFIGSEGTGLDIFNRNSGQIKRFNLPKPQANHSSIIALECVGSSLWVGTYQAGLFKIDLATGASKYFYIPKSPEDPLDVAINCFKTDREGKIWIGTNGKSIYRFDPVTNKLESAIELFQLKPGQKIPINDFITVIEQDHSGNLWFGSNGTGIAVYSPSKKTFQVLNSGNSGLPMDRVQSIFCDHSGKIWVGSLGGGLCLFKPASKSFERYDERNSLSNEVIYKILEDEKGKLWVSTNSGISSFDINKKVFKNFTHYNGVQQSTFNIGSGFITKDKTIFFGGLDGFNYFKSGDIFQKNNIPILVTTNLKINNKQVFASQNSEISSHISGANEIELSYRQNFSIDFIALNYTAPHENRYAYKLEGFDKEWIDAGTSTTAVYTNLDPKTYTFRLIAQSEDGSWKTPQKIIKVIVKPPFYRTYYAYFTYLILIGFALYTIRWSSIKKLKNDFARKQERLEMNHLIEKERHEAEQKMELEKVKIKFLTNLSHELKTPLTLVLNPIENLLFEEKNTERLEMLNLIGRNAKRLLNLVNQLLDFRSIEDNELTLHKTDGDLVTFTQEIVDSFKYISVRKNISLHFISAFSNYNTSFDKDKLERILINLLSNALKFTNNGGNVSLQLIAEGNAGIKMIIRDSGIGFSEELAEKIFDRFYQGQNNADTLNQGSGIGLSIAQEFVKLHGGNIKVDSEEGVGSAFTISLPLIATNFEPINSPLTESNATVESFAKNEPPKIEKPVVLIVDDDADLRAYLVESLNNKYKIIEAADGKQGWQKALSAHPQLIISDVNMPVIDGIEMVKKIKNDNRTRHIPIIMLTVLSEESEQLKGLEAGASDYLTKPFSFHLLNIKIENLLSLNSLLKDTYSKHIQIEKPEIELVSEDEKFLLKINLYVEENIENPNLTVEELSKAMYVSRGTLYARILNLTGESPVEYVRSLKLEKAVGLLKKNEMKISQIAYAVGFSNPNYFARAFKAKYNLSPSEYQSIHKL